MKIISLSNEHEKIWSDYVLDHPEATIFHTIEWKEVIEEVYGFQPLYFLAIDDNDVVQAIFPSFYANSILFGKKVISTPFNFYNGPLYSNKESADMILAHAVKAAKDKKAKYLELKFLTEMDPHIQKNSHLKKRAHYFISKLDLCKTHEDAILKYQKGLRRNVKRRTKKTEEDGIILTEVKSVDEIMGFYDIMVQAYRDKFNMIPQPYKLFRLLFEKFQPKDQIKIFMMKKDEDIVGGIFLLFFNKTAVDAWGITSMKYQKYSPLTVLVDHAIGYAISRGCKYFDMGVTSPAQESLLDFKGSWGCIHSKLPYYYRLIESDEIPHLDYHTSFKGMRKMFRYVPLSIIKIISPYITRQLA